MKTATRIAFETEALPHIADLYGAALRYTRNPAGAEDLVQETFLRAYAAWSSFIPGSNCRAWLLRILTNTFLSGCRRKRTQRQFAARGDEEHVAVLYDEDRAAHDPERALTAGALGDEVTRALAELPEDYRLVVLLADIEGLKYREIADAVGCPIGTIMSRLFRARRMLQEKLATYAQTDYGISRRAA